MVKRVGRLSKLILLEIILLFLLVVLLVYAPTLIEMDSISDALSKFLNPAVTIVFVLLITKIFVTFLEPVFKKALKSSISSAYNIKYTWQFIDYLIWIIAFIILTFILIGNLISIGIFAGLFFIIIIIISHRIIANFSGWLYIIFSRPIQKGDLVNIDGIKGKIIEITTMNIVLEEKSDSLKESGYTGGIAKIPNYFIFSKPISLISSSESIVWDEINVLLDSKSNYLLAEDIVEDIAKSIAGPAMKKSYKYMKRKFSSSEDITPIPRTNISIEKKGVQIKLRYYCEISKRSEIRSTISEAVLKEFRQKRIQIIFES